MANSEILPFEFPSEQMTDTLGGAVNFLFNFAAAKRIAFLTFNL